MESIATPAKPVVAAVGGQIERDRQAFLTHGQIAAVERIRVGRGRETGVLPDGPGLVDVHRRVRAAQERGDSGIRVEEVQPGQIVGAVTGGDLDPLGGGPGLTRRGGRLHPGPTEIGGSEIRQAHQTFNSSNA
jgi:hypothetical protein